MLYNSLQLWVGEKLTPWKISEIGGVALGKTSFTNRVANNTSGIHLWSFIFSVEALAAGEKEAEHGCQ